MAVSKLMTHGLNRAAVNNSLLALKNYAVDDKGMKVNSVPFLKRLATYCTNFEVIFILRKPLRAIVTKSVFMQELYLKLTSC